MNVLRELWYGHLELGGVGASTRKEYKELLHLLGRNEGTARIVFKVFRYLAGVSIPGRTPAVSAKFSIGWPG